MIESEGILERGGWLEGADAPVHPVTTQFLWEILPDHQGPRIPPILPAPEESAISVTAPHHRARWGTTFSKACRQGVTRLSKCTPPQWEASMGSSELGSWLSHPSPPHPSPCTEPRTWQAAALLQIATEPSLGVRHCPKYWAENLGSPHGRDRR